MKLRNYSKTIFQWVVFVSLLLSYNGFDSIVSASSGQIIYMKQCASCHGKSGQGVKGEYEDALYGDWSVNKIKRYIEKNMPEDDPDLCVGEDAVKVAEYVYQKFYSDEAKFRNAPKKIELTRLTNRQYRESVTDLFQINNESKPRGVNDRSEFGLKASYYNSKGMNKKDNLKLERIDKFIDFDFGSGPPMEGIKSEQFSIAWEGSLVVKETGTYGLRLITPNGARLYLNVNLKEGDKNRRDDGSKASTPPLIDAWVSSGNNTRTESVDVFLQGGRIYPMRFDYFKYKEKTGSIRFEWKPPSGSWSVPKNTDFSTDMGAKIILSKTSFPADDRSLGYERGIGVSEEWFNSLTRSALDVAEQFDTEVKSSYNFKSNNEDGKKEEYRFVATKILERAFRRPLSEEEKEENIGRVFKEVGSPDIALKRIVLLAVKSPHFLYPGLPAGKDESHRIASRIALGLWDSIPDSKLLEVAKSGGLNSEIAVRKQVERMIDNPRTKSKILDFFYHWLDLDYERDVAKDAKIYPAFGDKKIADLRESMNMFIEDVFWSKDSDFRELFLSKYLYLNKGLASTYGKSTQTEDFDRIEFNESERSGLITHPYILTQFSYPYNSSPIHRGVFLTRHLLGRTLKPPPVAVSFENQNLDPTLSMREKVTEVTKSSNCMSCHEIINSLGFSLENYDAIGRWRTIENNKDIDVSSEYETSSGKMISLRGSRSLAEFIANDPQSHKAFIKTMFEYMVKQPLQAYGANALEELYNSFRDSNFNCKALIVEVICISSMKGIELRNL